MSFEGKVRRVYCDHNATTPVHPDVLEAMLPFLRERFGNPSSSHWFGRQARAAVEEAREHVAALIGAKPNEIVFCSGGSESDNTAIKGAAALHPANGEWRVIASAIEHSAVLASVRHLGANGYRAVEIGATADGVVDIDALKDALDEKTAVVSVMHANNETGIIQPVSAIAGAAKARGALMHTDAVQSAGKIPVDVNELGADLLSISAHKIYGPKGVGALYVQHGLKLPPLIHGGHHERGMRAGTENVAGIAGFGKACQIALRGLSEYAAKTAALRDRMQRALAQSIPGLTINGDQSRRLPNTLHIGIGNVDSEMLLIKCDMEGLALSSGSACMSGATERSHVMKAMGAADDGRTALIRISVGMTTAEEEVDHAAALLARIAEESKR